MLALGLNAGHGFFKGIVNDESGNERSVIFPSLVAKAGRQVAGAIDKIDVVQLGDNGGYWVGEDALYGNAKSSISKARLKDPIFIPALVRAGLERLGVPREPSVLVSGLPAGWANELESAQQLGELLRMAAAHTFSGSKINVIAEPLGVLYSLALGRDGNPTGDESLTHGRVAIVDIGHYTVDLIIVNKLKPEPNSGRSFDLGTRVALDHVRQLIATRYEMDLTLFQVDQAVRQNGLLVAGDFEALPHAAHAVLADAGSNIATNLVESLRSSGGLQKILIAGGGAELAPLANAIASQFKQAVVVPNAQLSIATGYARLARRTANKVAQQ